MMVLRDQLRDVETDLQSPDRARQPMYDYDPQPDMGEGSQVQNFESQVEFTDESPDLSNDESQENNQEVEQEDEDDSPDEEESDMLDFLPSNTTVEASSPSTEQVQTAMDLADKFNEVVLREDGLVDAMMNDGSVSTYDPDRRGSSDDTQETVSSSTMSMSEASKMVNNSR
jgi:hypothetical protein